MVVEYEEGKSDEEEDDEEEEEEDDVGGYFVIDVVGFVSKEEGVFVLVFFEIEQLVNSDLWWNWQKFFKEKEFWSVWYKCFGDSDSVSFGN